MPTQTIQSKGYLTQKTRLFAFVVYIILLLAISKTVTGELFPTVDGKRLWLLGGIGFWCFSLISAPFFRPPRDSLANVVAAGLLLSLIDVSAIDRFGPELNVFRWIAVSIAAFVGLSAIVAMTFHGIDTENKPNLAALGRTGYLISDVIGRGEVIFTSVALVSIVGFYQNEPLQQLWLLFIWSFLIFLKPVELLLRLRNIFRSMGDSEMSRSIGTLRRVDNPNIMRVALEPDASWEHGKAVIACLPNLEQAVVYPLFHHVQDAELVGTGLISGPPELQIENPHPGRIYEQNGAGDWQQLVDELSQVPGKAQLAGIAVEGTTISTLNFEAVLTSSLQEGALVFCRIEDQLVFYQVLDARTSEESFEQNPRGRHIVSAAQLGVLDKKVGFKKFGWLPDMNSLVFVPVGHISPELQELGADEFELGNVSGSTELKVRIDFKDLVDYHTAILGMTGKGKTELALEFVSQALGRDTKVFCVDFTGEYRARLDSYEPESLSLDAGQALELDKRLFDVATGTFGAGDEKKALQTFVEEIRPPIVKKVDEFLSAPGAGLGIFELPEITNTKATLRATELYLSSIIEWARDHRKARRILIVLEEAHTIIPEIMGSGFDYDTQWVVGRISQIALQGRKYGVGLLIMSQRTALVSKSILSQCNTVITFSLVDKTSLDYLSNVYSAEHVKAIPNLRFLEALAFGKAVRSERPILVSIPFDEEKKKASKALDVTIPENPADG